MIRPTAEAGPETLAVGPRRKVAAVLETGHGGRAVLAGAAELAGLQAVDLTVLAIAPQAAASRCCGISVSAYNREVRESVSSDLSEAARRLGARAAEARFVMLVDGVDPSLTEWVSAHQTELVLLPARWRGLPGSRHPAAGDLRQLAGVEVRVL